MAARPRPRRSTADNIGICEHKVFRTGKFSGVRRIANRDFSDWRLNHFTKVTRARILVASINAGSFFCRSCSLVFRCLRRWSCNCYFLSSMLTSSGSSCLRFNILEFLLDVNRKIANRSLSQCRIWRSSLDVRQTASIKEGVVCQNRVAGVRFCQLA